MSQSKMIDNLAEELKLEIIHKLPIKTLGQCSCLSKSWLSLIENPSFISAHLKRTNSSNNPNHFLLFRTSSDQFALRSDNDEFDVYKQLNLPFGAQNPNFRCSGTCNGLICLIEQDCSATYVEESIVLWNPIIKKTLTLPKPNIPRLPAEVFHGLGYDSSTNDYKVVRILGFEGAATETEIFSHNRNSWTTVTPFAPNYNICHAGTRAFVNGVLHWIARDVGRNVSVCCQIVGLDMASEEFREIELPKAMDGRSPLDMTISVCKESLLAVCFHDFNTTKDMEIWVMEEYGNVESWTMIGKLDWQYGQLPATLGFRNNGEVFLERRENVYETGIISVDVKNGEQKDVGIRDGAFCHDPIHKFVESLALLDNPNAVSYTIVPTDANFASDASEGSDASDDEPMDRDDSSGEDSNGDASNA